MFLEVAVSCAKRTPDSSPGVMGGEATACVLGGMGTRRGGICCWVLPPLVSDASSTDSFRFSSDWIYPGDGPWDAVVVPVPARCDDAFSHPMPAPLNIYVYTALGPCTFTGPHAKYSSFTWSPIPDPSFAWLAPTLRVAAPTLPDSRHNLRGIFPWEKKRYRKKREEKKKGGCIHTKWEEEGRLLLFEPWFGLLIYWFARVHTHARAPLSLYLCLFFFCSHSVCVSVFLSLGHYSYLYLCMQPSPLFPPKSQQPSHFSCTPAPSFPKILGVPGHGSLTFHSLACRF